ncbi:MAG: hypothetical protein PVI79_07800 [Gammaproteobacteria bacterium]|jgi:hypothetical protein
MHELKSQVVVSSAVLVLLIAGIGNVAIAARSGDNAVRGGMNSLGGGQSIRNPDPNQIEFQSRATLQTRYLEQEQLRWREQEQHMVPDKNRVDTTVQLRTSSGHRSGNARGGLTEESVRRRDPQQETTTLRKRVQEQLAAQERMLSQQQVQAGERPGLMRQQQETPQ